MADGHRQATRREGDDEGAVDAQGLRASEERHRHALSAARMVAWEWVAEGNHLVCSDTAEEVFGLPPGTTIDTPRQFIALLHPDDVVAHKAGDRAAAAAGLAFVGQYRLIRPVDGAAIWIETRGRGVRDPDGQVVRAWGVVMDVDARLRAEQERAEAVLRNHLKDDHLARISHELRTPLAGLRMWVQVLRSGRIGDRADAIDAIDRCARAQSKLIEDLLDLARGANGKLRITEEILDPRHAIQEAVAVVRPEAEARSVELVTALARDAGLVRGDAGRLQQVAWNLLSNAVKFTPPGGRVEVTLRGDETSVVVAVNDSGMGLDADAMGSLFTPFQQSGRGDPGVQAGLGLGLVITRQLVELHGGTIRAESRGEGRGACFTVTLPRVEAAEQGQIPSPLPAAAPAAQPLLGLRVLLVEDHASTRNGIARVLSVFGAEVTAAAGPAIALEALGRVRHDVILSDLAMPEEDGCAFLRRVRRLEGEIGQIPAVALTAHARPEDAARALAAGFRRYLAKPVDPQHLVEALIKVTKQPGSDPLLDALRAGSG